MELNKIKLNKYIEFNNTIKDNIGLIFLSLSIIMLGYMLISPFTHEIIHVDEYFTLSVLYLPLKDLFFVTSHDVHPPLYYLILKVVTKFLTMLGIEFNRIFVYKLISVVPYAIILILSATKIKDDHGYFTAGLFAFSMAVMSEFFVHYLMMRMYSWAILFVVLAFIFLKDVLDKNDKKSWALFTAFSVLAAYTHYFAAIPIACIYLALFVYLFRNDKQKLKYWIISTACGILLFAPWIPSLMSQLAYVSEDFWIPEITVEVLIGFLGYFIFPEKNYVNVIFIAIFIAFLINTLRNYKNNDKIDNFYILCGLIAYLGTIIIGTTASFLLRPLMVDRYLLPAAAILWFITSFMITKIDNKKTFLISFILVLLLLIAGTAHMVTSNEDWGTKNMNKEAFFDQISKDNDSIVINTAYSYRLFYLGFCNSTDMYLLNKPNEVYGFKLKELHDTYKFKEISKDGIPKLIEKNPDKNIYIISKKGYSDENVTTKPIIKSGSVVFSKVEH